MTELVEKILRDGLIRNPAELSRFALNIHPVGDNLEPFILTAKDLPYLPEETPSLLEKSNRIIWDMKRKAREEQAAGFVNRTQMGFPAWAGPPGVAESRPLKAAIEGGGGQVLNWNV